MTSPTDPTIGKRPCELSGAQHIPLRLTQGETHEIVGYICRWCGQDVDYEGQRLP